jgi:hypothetical protein
MSDQYQRGTKKLSDNEVRDIRQRFALGDTIKKIQAAYYEINPTYVYDILTLRRRGGVR